MSVPSAPLTPHAPFAAAASLDFGAPGERAVISLAGEPPAPRDFWVGCRHGPDAPWSLLPFFHAAPGGPAPLPKGRYGRFLGWAGDMWMIGPLVFKLCTPFDPRPEPDDDRLRHAPVLCGYLEYDNTHGDDPVELAFGFGGAFEPLVVDGGTAFGLDGAFGFATAVTDGVETRRDAAIFDADLGPAAALHFSVPPRAKRVHPLALGFYRTGYHYSAQFAGLADVLAHGLANHAHPLAVAEARDAEFMRSALTLPARAEAAHAVRVWLAQTVRRAGDPEVDLGGLRALCAAVK